MWLLLLEDAVSSENQSAGDRYVISDRETKSLTPNGGVTAKTEISTSATDPQVLITHLQVVSFYIYVNETLLHTCLCV